MDKINEFGDKLFEFVKQNANNPFFWLIILIVLMIICFGAIKDLSSK